MVSEPDGYCFDGEWHKGSKDGAGKETRADGSVWSVAYRMDELTVDGRQVNWRILCSLLFALCSLLVALCSLFFAGSFCFFCFSL
jgi:hypothetical protein